MITVRWFSWGVIGACCMVLLGCARPMEKLAATEWFPFESGREWSLRDTNEGLRHSSSDRESTLRLVVGDASRSGSTARAVLELPDLSQESRSYLPTAMAVEATQQGLSANYLWSGGGRVSFEVEPAIIILKVPFLNGDSWTWEGRLIAVDPHDDYDRRARIPATATMKESRDEVSVGGKREPCVRVDVLVRGSVDSPRGHETLDIGYKFYLVQRKGIVRYETWDTRYPDPKYVSYATYVIDPKF